MYDSGEKRIEGNYIQIKIRAFFIIYCRQLYRTYVTQDRKEQQDGGEQQEGRKQQQEGRKQQQEVGEQQEGQEQQ